MKFFASSSYSLLYKPNSILSPSQHKGVPYIHSLCLFPQVHSKTLLTFQVSNTPQHSKTTKKEMGFPKLTPVFLLTAAITLTLTQTTALMPYTRNPIWDLMLPPDIDPLRILEHAPLPIPKDSEPLALARCDWKETPTAHVITVDVPGLGKEDVKVEVEEENRVLRISGERKAEVEEKEGEKWHRAERVSAKFVRQFRLPADADLEGVKVRLENGVLRIVVPKVAEEKRKGAKVVSIEEVGSGGDGDVKASNKAEL